MTKMVSPPYADVLKDQNRRDHTPRNSKCQSHSHSSTISSKSHSQSSSKSQKNNLKESTIENVSSSRSSHRIGNHRRSSSSSSSNSNSSINNNKNKKTKKKNNQDDIPPPSPLMSKRQARVLDRWATQQARETMTTIKRNNQRDFNISAISDNDYVSFKSGTPSRDPSPTPSDSSVLSLVQKWREFETAEHNQALNDLTRRSNQNQNDTNFRACSIYVSRTDSTASSNSTNAWEIDQVSTNGKHISVGDSYSQGDIEKERVRVIDIIKKLPLVDCREAGTSCSTPVFCSPRIRGRQALSELLSKLERDRYNEINETSKHQIVSKFPKRGFLQSMLKGRFEASTQEQEQEQQPCSVLQVQSCTSKMDSIPLKVVQDMSLQEEMEDEHAQLEDVTWFDTKNFNGVVKNIPSCEVWEDRNEDEMVCEVDREEVYDDNYFVGMNIDWISDILRPRSYWNSLRQAWYDEIFATTSKHEIRQLIERGSVSTVLASDFPNKMDKIIMNCCVQRKAKEISYDDEYENQLTTIYPYEQKQSLTIKLEEDLQDHQHQQEYCSMQENPIETTGERRKEFDREKNEEEGGVDPERSCSHQYDHGGYYNEQAQAPWKNYNSQEDSDISEHFESTHYQEQSSSTNYCDPHTQGATNIKKNSSLEMEVIYDVRAQLEKMYDEMSELRKSVNICLDMQTKLQSSIKDEVSVALGLSNGNGKESNGKVPKKGCCCVCYEKKANSVMYRCGHICACFKCAHELQWSSGKCPICRAQIVDVVRVFTHV